MRPALEATRTPATGEGSAFTGRKRDRKPKRSVKIVDRIARSLITVGGIGSIVAVSMVGVFLVWVAAPLFRSPDLGEGRVLAAAAPTGAEILDSVPNEYLTLAWQPTGDGRIRVVSLLDGAALTTLDISPDAEPTAFASHANGGIVLGYADGTLRFGTVDFDTEYLADDDLPAGDPLRDLAPGAAAPMGEGVVQRTPEGQLRLQTVDVAMEDPVLLADAPVRLLDLSFRADGPVVAAADADGVVYLRAASRRRNLLTGEVTTRLRGGELDLSDTWSRRGAPAWLLLNGQGDDLFAAWRDGSLLRVETGDIRAPETAETVDLTGPAGPELTSLAFQIGKSSLIAGDADGGLHLWYRVRDADADTPDGMTMVAAKTMPSGTAAVTSLAASSRSRMFAAGFADGTVRLYHATNERLLAVVPPVDDGGAVTHLDIAPRDDALLYGTGNGLALRRVDVPHPEASFRALLTPVWYEGYDAPAHVWQSSGGTDDFEPKYGLMPLIFGTLKATFYTMLFGLPLALLAAVYSSEFLEPHVKARVKPAIEMMASLPSVVLGFLAALVFAPFLEGRVPQALASLYTVPFCLLLGAHLWQMLPGDVSIRHQRLRLPGMFVMLPLGLLLAGAAGGPVERLLFAGDLRAWLDGQVGSGAGGWAFLLLPLAALAVGILTDRLVDPALRRASRGWSRERFAAADLVKFLCASLATPAVALALAWILGGAGLDPRGTVLGTYVQRNALVVGFVMGFAVIPIIYTIAEDALSAVPDHLRAASLGAGATTWQTAVRVVIPPAMSGLFSATMIGLGRAVGETMIVLMAAGNTPIMDWNIFNGFRTLSANIAVELPEAVQNSTHFRTLFLAALTLFAMTFVLNTVAEIVRMRFRRKAYQL